MNRPLDIKSCSVCGKDHNTLLTYPLAVNETIKGLVCTRYAVCPSTGYTIYIAYQDTKLETIQKPK